MTVYRTYITMLVDGLVTYNDSVQDLYHNVGRWPSHIQ